MRRSNRRPARFDRIVFLGAAPNLSAEKLKSRTLFIVARDDANDDGPRLPRIRAQYEKAPEPKQLIVVEGSAHAQFLFQTDQSDYVMREILRFLSVPRSLIRGEVDSEFEMSFPRRPAQIYILGVGYGLPAGLYLLTAPRSCRAASL